MRTLGLMLGAALTMAAAGVVIASSVEDDLAVVKRAVAGQKVARQEAPVSTAQPAPADEPAARVDDADDWERQRAARPRAGGGRDLRWFKVRITEKGAKKARVNVNVPIALVRALGDDFPIDLGHNRRWRRGRDGDVRMLRLGEVLATLEAGQSLVEIDDDDATVRIWVE